MKLKVKTQDDRLYTLDLQPNVQICEIKSRVHELDAELDAGKYRVLYQGRFLEDEDELESVGIGEGHTVLLVPKPPPSRRRQRSTSADMNTGRTHPSLRRFPPEVLRFLQAQHRVFAMIQAQRGGRQNGATDEELDAMENQLPMENLEVHECDSSDLLLGFAFGFLLGPIAGLCLIESALSRRLRAGMLIGIICEVVVALFKMATHIPKGV